MPHIKMVEDKRIGRSRYALFVFRQDNQRGSSYVQNISISVILALEQSHGVQSVILGAVDSKHANSRSSINCPK